MKISGIPNSPQPGTGPLVPGKSYHFTVISSRTGSAEIRLEDGTQLTVRINTPVARGLQYQGRALTASSMKLPLQQPTANLGRADLPTELGLPDRAASDAVIRAFVRTGLPLSRSSLLRALRRAERDDNRLSVRERARLAALLEERGIEAESAWNEMSALLGGSGEDSGNREDNQRESAKPREDIASELSGSIRFSESGNHALQLFNHATVGDEHWIVIPYTAAGQKGTIRLRVPTLSSDSPVGEIEFTEAIVEVRHAGARTMIYLENTDSVLSVTRVAGDPLPPSIVSPLRRRLEAFGVSALGLDVKTSTGEFDGFSIKEDADILPRTDRRA